MGGFEVKKIIGCLAVISVAACGASKQDGAKVLANMNTSMQAASAAVASGVARDTGSTEFKGNCAGGGTFDAILAVTSNSTANSATSSGSIGYTFTFAKCVLADKSAFDGGMTWTWIYNGTGTSTDTTATGSLAFTYKYVADGAKPFSYTDGKGATHTLATDATGVTVTTAITYDLSKGAGSYTISETVNGSATIDGTKFTYTDDKFTQASGSY